MGGWVNRLAVYGMKQSVASDYEGGFSTFNLGVSGEDIRGIQERFETEIENRLGRHGEQDIIVVLAVGVNDSQVDIKTGEHRTELDEYKEKLQSMITSATENGRSVVCIGLAPIDESVLDPMPWKPTHAYRVEEVATYNEAIRNVAEENEILFISLENLFGDTPGKYTTDGIHPTAEGHRLIFERVKKVLEEEKVI